MPTGAGKSLIIASIVQALREPCLIFQPSKEILEQNYEKLQAYGFRPSIFSASARRREIGDITLATIGSVVKRTDQFSGFRYVIIDECHLVNSKGGMYASFLSSLSDARILGLTATPFRLTTDGYGGSILKFLTRTRPRVFHQLVYYVDTGTLFRAGYLAKLEYHAVKGMDRSQLKLNTTGADYTDESVQKHFSDIGFEDKLERVVRRLLEIGRKNALVFTRFVKESQYLSERIPGAAIVTAETPKAERESIIARFRDGTIRVVCNVGVLTTGFDYPELETVVLARPTMSLGLYYQMTGRCVRPHPAKPFAMVVDMAGLQEQFGKIEDLVIRGRDPKWFMASNGKPLTNVYFGEPPQQRYSQYRP